MISFHHPTLPPLIAVVGCDGSGKSTVTEILGAWLAEFQPASVCHLGKQSGNIGRALARLPMFGTKLEHTLYKKAKTVRTEKGPTLMTAIVIYAFTLRRARRFRRMLRLRRAGNTIITDRYPQIDIPGAIDGPLLNLTKPDGFIGWLARKEQARFAAMVAILPDLIIRLNVSLPVAEARKPDHRPSSLARKIGDLSKVTFQGAPIAEINADDPLTTVVTNAKSAITHLLKTGYGITLPAPRTAE